MVGDVRWGSELTGFTPEIFTSFSRGSREMGRTLDLDDAWSEVCGVPTAGTSCRATSQSQVFKLQLELLVAVVDVSVLVILGRHVVDED